MRRTRTFTWVTVACLMIGAVWSPVLSGSENALRGWFRLSDERIDSEAVTVTLHLLLFNRGDVDTDPLPLKLAVATGLGEPLNVLENASVPARSQRPFAVELTIPADEYQRWRLGVPPKLYLAQPTAEGTTRATKIELIPHEFEIDAVGTESRPAVEIMRQTSDAEIRP